MNLRFILTIPLMHWFKQKSDIETVLKNRLNSARIERITESWKWMLLKHNIQDIITQAFL